MPTLPLSEPAHVRWGLALLLRNALESLVEHVNRRLEPLNVTFAQCPALLFLVEVGGATPSELALATDTDTGAMTRLIDRLKAKGLCSSVRSSRDRRLVHIALTAEGTRVAQGIGTVLDEILELHLAGFGKEDRAALGQGLSRMVANGLQLRDGDRAKNPEP